VAQPFEQAFADERHGTTLAVLLMQGGEVVAERYSSGIGPDTTLPSWSIAKSVLHAVVGLCVADGTLRADDVGPCNGATLADLLEMRTGLAWREEYEPDQPSDVQEMLWGEGRLDTAAFACSLPVAHPPGAQFCYSSGTTNIASAMIADVVGRGGDYVDFLRRRLLGPLEMASATPKLDGAGSWIASSYLFATARDFARFGQLYLDRGRDLLPDGWTDDGAQARSTDDDGARYGRHWWCWDDGTGTYEARGYDGQYLTIAPHLDAVLVRLGRTPAALRPNLRPWREEVLTSLS
jgi:CubicO group peptidase (beta-lactamase class C family)